MKYDPIKIVKCEWIWYTFRNLTGTIEKQALDQNPQ